MELGIFNTQYRLLFLLYLGEFSIIYCSHVICGMGVPPLRLRQTNDKLTATWQIMLLENILKSPLNQYELVI